MKRKHLLLIAALSLSLTTTAAATTITACKHSKPPVVQVTETVTGTYYVDDDGVEKTIELDITSFTLNFGDGVKEGSYGSFENGTLSLLFDNSEKATAVFDTNVIRLNYGGRTYTMYRKINFTVSFNMDGGSAVDAQTVMNGKTATRPEVPARENSAFIGWYKDSGYAEKFDFQNEIITANTTVYARFITINAELNEYYATFDLGEGVDGSYAAVKSINRKFYNLPENVPDKNGNKFLGWWLSYYYDGTKLASKYENQEIYEDTVLYAVWESDAPAVSVTENGANWSAKGTNKMFDVVIKNARGTVVKEQRGAATSVEYDFPSARAGEYTVEVTMDGNTTVAYYKNRALARVKNFKVEDDIFGFLPIDTEHKLVEVTYYMDLECGDANHKHEHEQLEGQGFDFSNCPMKKGGIRFRITAEAVNYTASVSEWFTLERDLEEVTGLAVDPEKDEITWNAVENAKSYKLVLSLEGGETIEKTVTTTSFDMRSLKAGNWTIKVSPFNYTYNLPEATECTYTKTKIASPSNFTVTNEQITWDAVEGAESYTLYVNGAVQADNLTTNSFAIPSDLFTDTNTEYGVTVVAHDAAKEFSSLPSKPVYIHGELGEITYRDGVISWDAVIGIVKFGVKVGDGEEIFVTDGSNRASVAFAESGVNEITVTAYVGDGQAEGSKTLPVTVFTVVFNTLGGEDVENQYKAEGDTVTLPAEPHRLGYTFLGWFNQAENGTKYDGETMTFNSAKPTVYANWKANTYKVTLVVGPNGALEEDAQTEFEVTFGESFQFPTATSFDETKEFTGWFTSTLAGTHCTDNMGFSQFNWNIAQDTTLYAQWGHAGVSYVLKTNGKEYIASKGAGVNNLSTVTVLATYKGLPVTDLAPEAFSDCNSVKKLRLPSSLQNIFYGTDGGQFTVGASFYRLNALEEVEVYDAGGEQFFASVDGCLLTVTNGELDELVFVPSGRKKTATFTVPEGTKRIAPHAYGNSGAAGLEKLIIPASVTFIADWAFSSSNSALKEVVFLPAANGQLGDALDIRDNVFNGCTSLTEITFPKRLASLSVNAFSGTVAVQKIYIQELGATKDRNTNYYDYDGVLCKGDEIVYCPRGYKGNYQIPSGVKSIGEAAFKNCTGLTGVQFTGMVEKIGINAFSGCSNIQSILFDQYAGNEDLEICEGAFDHCTSLTEVVLPPNLQKIAAGAFNYTQALHTVTVNCNRSNPEYENGAFAYINTNGKITNYYVTNLHIGKNVTLLSLSGVFGSKLETVTVDKDNPNYKESDGVIYNGDYSQILFCPNGKTEFVFSDEVTVISNRLFKDKTDLISVTIGAGVERIEESAFEGCTNLQKVVFKEGVKELEIQDRAFYNCSSIITLEFNGRGGAAITLGDEVFSGEVLKGDKDVIIGEGDDQKTFKLTEITLPDGVKSIGKSAFSNRGRLQVINLPASLEKLGEVSADAYSSEFKAVVDLKLDLFTGCAALQNINVAEGGAYFVSIDGVLYGKENGVVTTLLFAGQQNQGALMLEAAADESTEEVPQYGYLQVPATVNKIAVEAVYNNKKIKKVVIEGEHSSFAFGVKAFGSTLSDTSVLEEINIPKGTVALPESLFENCISLKAIEIPNTVTKIYPAAFKKCKALASVIFENGNDSADLHIGDGIYTNEEHSGSISYTVTGAFAECNSLTEVVFPKRLKTIGSSTFICTGTGSAASQLASVQIPVTVTRIGQSAFLGCGNLTEVIFTGEVTAQTEGMSIEQEAFKGTALTEITLPANVTSIGVYAFSYTKLSALTLPARLETLGALFDDYSYNKQPKDSLQNSLKTVTFATMEVEGKQINNLTTFVSTAGRYMGFQGLTSLTSLVGFEYCTNLTEIPNKAFMETGLTSVKIPVNVTSIGLSAFENSTSLASLTFCTDENGKSKVSYIGNYAFKNTALEAFTFPTLEDGSIELGANLFEACKSLTDLTISPSVQNIGAALTNAPNLQNIITQDGSGVIKDENYKMILTLTSEANRTYKITSAFGAVKLDEKGRFVIPSTYNGGTITEIGDGAFASQVTMKGLVIPETVQVIGNNAFKQCVGIESVEFTGNPTLVSIGDTAFAYTYSLKKIVLPNSVKSIGYQCFTVSGVQEVTMPDELMVVGSNVFDGCMRLETVKNFSKLNLGSTLTSNYSGQKFFQNCHKLKNFTLADGADTLPSQAFYSCKGLEKIDITGVTAFINTAGKAYAESIFDGCTALEEVVLDAELKTLSFKMFNGCTALRSVYRSDTPIADRVEGKVDLSQIETLMAYSSSSAQPGQLYGCSSIVEVDIRSLKGFGNNEVFMNCKSLVKVTLSSRYSTLPDSLFSGCSSLKTVNYWDGEKIVGNDNEVTLVDGLDFLGKSTFASSGIEKIIIPTGLKVIGANATNTAVTSNDSSLFSGCAELREVLLPDSVTALGENVFKNCSSLTTIKYYTLNGGKMEITGKDGEATLTNITSIGNYCFTGCSSLTTVDMSNATAIGTAYNSQYKTSFFYECTSLTSVKLNMNLEALGSYMFAYCTSLEQIKLPDNLKATNTFTFYKSGLKSIELPASLKFLGTTKTTDTTISATAACSVFAECASLQTVTVSANFEKMGQEAFLNCTALTAFQVKDNAATKLSQIGKNAFKGCSQLKTIDLSKVTTSGTTPFSGCTSLTTANLSSATNTTLQVNMFDGCTSLSSVTLGNSITTLKNYMFQNCTSLQSINLNKVTSTGTYTFKGCTALTSITFGSCKTLGTNIFQDCTALQTLNLTGVTAVGNYAFAGCTKLSTVTFGAATLGTNSFQGCTSLNEVDLSSVTTVNNYAFEGCNTLTAVTLNKNLKSLGNYAFKGCSNLTTVYRSDTAAGDRVTNKADLSGLTTIGSYAFQGCSALTEVDASAATALNDYAFEGCNELATVIISGNLKTLGKYAFSGCSLLSTVYRADLLAADDAVATADEGEGEGGGEVTEPTEPEEPKTPYREANANKVDLSALTSIGAHAFEKCSALTEVILNDAMTAIGDTVFGWSGLTKINMPASLTSIEGQAFLSCASLESVVIPAGVTSLGTNLFNFCNNLTVEVAAENETFEINANGWLVNKKDNTVLFIPLQTKDGEGEATAVTEVNLADGSLLRGYMFSGYSTVQKVTLPSDLTEIPNYAFWNFQGSFGTDFVIPAGVTSIGDGAFQRCTTLTEIVIPEGVTSIGANAFNGCTNLTKITLPSTLQSIGASAFVGCTNLTNISFSNPAPADDTQAAETGLAIGDSAFKDCVGLTGSFTLPDGIASIGNNCFEGCTGISTVTFGAGLSKIGDYAFSGCTGLTAITFGAWSTDGETSLGDYAFNGCSSLQTVTFSSTGPKTFRSTKTGSNTSETNKLKTRETYTFNGCANLSTIKLGEGLTAIPLSTFKGMLNLTTVNIPYSVTSIDANAFYGCTKLASVTFDETPEGTAAVAITLAAGTQSVSVNSDYLYVDKFGVGYQGVFAGCTALKTIALPSRMTSIGANAFIGTGLTSVTIPTGVTTIGNYAFMYTKITSVAIPYTVTSIGTASFGGCEELTSVTFDETPEGQTAKELTLPSGGSSTSLTAGNCYYNEEDGKYYRGAFIGAAKLTKVTLPKRTKTNTGTYAFAFSGLTEADTSGIAAIGDYMFYACKSLTKVTVSEGTTKIGSYVFSYCTNLSDIKIPKSMAEFGSFTFSYCTSIKELVIPVTMKFYIRNAYGWTADQKVVLDTTGKELEAGGVWNFQAIADTDAVFEVRNAADFEA